MTGESSAAAESTTEPEPHSGAIRGLLASLIDAARTRLDLAAVEAEMFVLRTIQLLLWALAAVACALLALAFAIVSIVAALWDSHRMAGVLGGALLFTLLAAIFGFIASRVFRTRPQMLEGTLAQLQTDQDRAGGAT
ncbi:MAG TPA: phage holin family protein [Steroidobacteraceae bacterium]|nr:phage holin family protein [Steroidobacteraceae bacterium]